MKAFSFRSSKKQRSQEQPQQQQRSRPNFQLSISLSKSRSSQDQPRHDQIPTPSLTPSPSPSPAQSTVSFGAVSVGSLNTAHSHGPRSRPSLSILRPSGFHTISSDGHGYPYNQHHASETRTRPSIYTRFGFNRSTPHLQPRSSDASESPASAKTTTDYTNHPPLPTRPTPPPPPVPPKEIIVPIISKTEATLQIKDLPFISPPVPPTPPEPEYQKPRRSTGKTRLSIDGLQVPSEADVSTSTLLQRRRAKSLGPASEAAREAGKANAKVGSQITNLVIPPLVIDKTPLSLQPDTPASLSPASSLPTPTTPGGPQLVPMSAPLQTRTFLSYPHSHSPSPVPSRSQSPSYKHRSESSSLRSRSESGSSSRTRSESASSRARSESNASTSSSSRNGHRSKRASVRATMTRIDDAWAGFLKEVDEDGPELNGGAKIMSEDEGKKDGHLSPEYPLTPSETIKGSLIKPVLPLRSRSPSLGRAKSPDSGYTSSSSQTPTTATLPKLDKVLSSTSSSSIRRGEAIVVTVSPSPSTADLPSGEATTTITSAPMQTTDSASSLPYLRSPDTSLLSPDLNSLVPHGPPKPSAAPLYTPQPPAPTTSGGGVNGVQSPLLQAPEPPSSWHFNPNPAHNVNRMSTATFESEDSRPGSSYSQMSQFSLSMFPSPPSVVIRPTTEKGTFKVGSTGDSVDGRNTPTSARTLTFKSIVPSSNGGKSLVKSLFFTKSKDRDLDKESSGSEGGSRTATHSRATTPTPSDSGHTIEAHSEYHMTESRGESLPRVPMSAPPNMHTYPTPITPTTKPANYDALLESMESLKLAMQPSHSIFDAYGPSGSGTSRPGTSDSKFQWGYAL